MLNFQPSSLYRHSLMLDVDMYVISLNEEKTTARVAWVMRSTQQIVAYDWIDRAGYVEGWKQLA